MRTDRIEYRGQVWTVQPLTPLPNFAPDDYIGKRIDDGVKVVPAAKVIAVDYEDGVWKSVTWEWITPADYGELHTHTTATSKDTRWRPEQYVIRELLELP